MEYMILTAAPWFEPITFGTYYGAIGGGIGGPLIGVLAPLSMLMAQRGKARTAILALWFTILLAGVAQLAFGLYALVSGQPYPIWYAPVLCGSISTLLAGIFLVMAHRKYEQAESRKLDAAAFRNS